MSRLQQDAGNEGHVTYTPFGTGQVEAFQSLLARFIVPNSPVFGPS